MPDAAVSAIAVAELRDLGRADRSGYDEGLVDSGRLGIAIGSECADPGSQWVLRGTPTGIHPRGGSRDRHVTPTEALLPSVTTGARSPGAALRHRRSQSPLQNRASPSEPVIRR